MMNYTQLSDELRYQVELSRFQDDYQTTLKLFQGYLIAHDKVNSFLKTLREYNKGLITLEFVAMDWSIPVVMVKFYDNLFNKAI